jgi:RsiW-degrading membrane proteinase PrsW (M82 family)
MSGSETGKMATGVHLRKSLWLPNLLTFLLLAAFLVFFYAIDLIFKPQLNPGILLATGTLMALVPAVLWIAFFYRQDHLEPEPKHMVFSVFLLGGLLAAAVGIPLLQNIFDVNSWLYKNLLVDFLGSIMVIGFSQEFIKYAAVRFSVFNSAEFDERTDGIIYSTAAGLGFATVLNINFIVESGGVFLGNAAMRIVVVALAQASFSGITGYFLGREKLEKRPFWWTPLGVSIAAVLDGLFYFLWGNLTAPTLSTTGAFGNQWIGIILAILLAASVAALLSWLIARDIKKASSQSALSGAKA